MSAPDIQEEDVALVSQALRSGTLSLGPFLKKFEEECARFLGARHAVAVSSGTAGLHLCMVAAGLGEGDEVITTPFGFVSSANAILYERARPVFVDIDETSFNIDPEQTARAVTDRTRAILPVHVFGQPCAMTELMVLARKRGLYLVEDACEGLGSEYRGRKLGTLGDAGVFSFYPNKQITTGEGAIITTDDDGCAALFRSLRNQGREHMGAWLEHVRLGYNYRLDEMSAALGLSQISRIEQIIAARARVAALYDAALGSIAGLIRPAPLPDTSRMSWFVYVVRLPLGVNRDRVIARLAEKNVPSRAYFPPIHLQPYFRERFGYKAGDFPVTERVAASTLALPFHGQMHDEEVEYVAHHLRQALERAA